MMVVPANTKPQLPRSLDSSQRPREQKKESESFGDTLATALRSQTDAPTASPALTAPVGGHELTTAEDYRPALEDGTPVVIGEDAVRFNARPIVGRAFVAGTLVEVASPGYPEPAQQAQGSIDPLALEPELRRAIMLAAPKIGALVSGPAAWKITAPSSAGRQASQAKSAVARPAEPLAPTRANRWAASEGSAAPSPPSDPGKSEIRTDISLTLLADEVLVTVRGLDLSADEEEALADEARRLLASFDFGGRPLRVVTSRRA